MKKKVYYEVIVEKDGIKNVFEDDGTAYSVEYVKSEMIGLHENLDKAIRHYEKAIEEIGMENNVAVVKLVEVSTLRGLVLDSKVKFCCSKDKEGALN